MEKISFNVPTAIEDAWKMLWKNNLKIRHRVIVGSRWHTRTFYLTAADVENQVRVFADEAAQGEPRGAFGIACGRPATGIRFRGDLQGAVRAYLLGNVRRGIFSSHNFGRGHISGMRFRPASEAITDTEKTTMANKEARKSRPRPRHYNKTSIHGTALCVAESRKKAGRGYYSGHRSKAWVTRNADEVTCVRCKNLLAMMKCEAA